MSRLSRLTRRKLLVSSFALSAAGFVAACAPGTSTSTGAPTPATAPTAPAGAAPTSTAAAASAATPASPTKLATPGVASPVATAAASSSGATATESYAVLPNTTGNITFWHFWGSPIRRNAIRRIVSGFMAKYPGIKVTETFVPFGDIWTKAIAAVAAGSGMPDVLVEDRPQLKDRAKNNIDIGLADLAKRDHVTGDAFWPFTWEEALYNGVPYGLPYETDIRVTYYNKAEYQDAGLDPSKPPQNWDECWTYADKLDKKSGSKLEQVGFYPLYGMDLDQWAWNNGGEWQDKNYTPTLNAKPNVETLDWIKKWTDRYGKQNLDAFSGTFGQGKQDKFMSGKVSTEIDIQGYTSFLNFYNPSFATKDKKNVGYGVGPIPPNTGKKPASLSGGFALSIPRGVKQIDPAWEFIKYAVFVGQISWARDTYSMPTIEKVAKSDPNLNADPNWRFFVDAMAYGRPAVFNPYYPKMLELLGPARDAVLQGKMTAQQALDDAQKKAEAEIAKNKKA